MLGAGRLLETRGTTRFGGPSRTNDTAMMRVGRPLREHGTRTSTLDALPSANGGPPAGATCRSGVRPASRPGGLHMPGLEGGFRAAPAAGLPLSPARCGSRPAYSSLATLRSLVPAAIRL